ncbi:MAG: metallophosphoesterase family protein [Gemmatimonadota bacterium]
MLTLVHASDLHFGEPYLPEMGEAFQAAAVACDPDAIVLSGDFTQRAKVREYEQARAFIDRLPRVPLVVTPGNHDVPLYRVFERLFAPFRNYREHISDELDTVTRVGGAVIVSLSSAAPHHAIVNGRITPEQMEWAARVFRDGTDEDIRIVVAHHHLAPAPDYEGDKQLPRAREILDAFERMGVEMILGGHLHRAYIGNSLDVYPGEDRSRGLVIVQSGTTTSGRGRARERAKNSFNIVRVDSHQLEVSHHMYFEELDGFAPFSRHAFPRRARRYFASDRPTPAGARPAEDVA